ncbi:MAG: hypothetical protein H6843_06575 [Rhodospirillaceae bacterium]|nr:hypothetical protein [Rhodospirillaceae bacterium]
MLHLTSNENAQLAQMMTAQAMLLREDGMETEAGELLDRARQVRKTARSAAKRCA